MTGVPGLTADKILINAMKGDEEPMSEPQTTEGDLEEELAKQEEDKAPVPKTTAFTEEAVQKAEDIILDPSTYKWKVFLAGASGSGKTTALTTLPGRKLVVDFDGRSTALVGIPNLDIYNCHEPEPKTPKAWQKAERLRQVILSEVRQGIFPYDSILFDGLTMMGRISLNWALTLDSGRGLGGSPARQHYGPQMDNLAKFVLSTLALPLNIAYTGHIELIQDEHTGASKFYPKITGKLRTEVANWFNETYHCYRTEDDEGVLRYYWQTAGSGRAEFFKSSLNQLGKYWTDPIPIRFDDKGATGFADLFARRFKTK